MKDNIAFNRAYVEGMNTVKGNILPTIHTLKEHVQGLLNGQTVSRATLDDLSRSVGQLERYHAPNEIRHDLTNVEEWTGAACGQTENDWTQWIQIVDIAKSKNPTSLYEAEEFAAQTVMYGSDRNRIHIQWGSGRQAGYIHHRTSKWMSSEDFLETTCPPTNLLAALPPHENSWHGWLLQTGHITDTANETFVWYCEDTFEWYTTIIYALDSLYTCTVKTRHLRDALSGFDEHCTTLTETNPNEDEGDIYIVKGSIRLDGTYQGKKRTAVIQTAQLRDNTISRLLGAHNVK